MSIVAKRVIEALVNGSDLRLGKVADVWRVEVSGTDLLYRGMEFGSYTPTLFDPKESNMYFRLNPQHEGEELVASLLTAALKNQGYDLTVKLGDEGQLLVSNGLWEDRIPTKGYIVSLTWIAGKMEVPNYVRWHLEEGKSDWLMNHYKEYQTFGDLEAFCMTYTLTEEQALYGFKVAEEHLASLEG